MTPDLSRLPQLGMLLERHAAVAPIEQYGRRAVTEALRRALAEARERVRNGGPVPRPDELFAVATEDLAARRRGRLTRVVNATGVVLHTNLGRAPLSLDARRAVEEAAGYTTLEFERDEGARGSRTRHVGRLAAEACGAEAATVVNNGAAALVLVLAALSGGRETIVSRGELIEIGGSFRLPDIMAASGARLHEVGTTNRTRPGDYEAAASDRTGLILKVHQSNYRVVGFSETPSVEQLARVAKDASVPLAYDIGSGLLHDHRGVLAGEPSVEAALAEGADLVIFSGDKLLGGPQAGIIAGRDDLILRCSRHPLARALRIDKLQRAALEATLESHLRNDVPLDLPTWAMLHADPETLHARARTVADAIGTDADAQPSTALVGGGSMPGADLSSWAVALRVADADGFAARLRSGEPPIVARVEDGLVLLDLRTVAPSQDETVVAAVRAALGVD
ncbi:MAG: L-seryl-tRNA(Sec) selenium transferase [Actinobacteria bacterium]|nr:L-seryl-tRNA(Sec) selenium transferase [Actinomycetota bacterium]